jgi:hypothetical protein
MSVQRIAELNDLCRRAMGVAGRLVQTQGIDALSPAARSAVREKVSRFNEFTEANDPHGEHDFGAFEHDGEHDFGAFEHDGEKIFWKIDYYAPDTEHGSEDPADPKVTVRVLTVMLAEEY